MYNIANVVQFKKVKVIVQCTLFKMAKTIAPYHSVSHDSDVVER